jgi:hypothetical protein
MNLDNDLRRAFQRTPAPDHLADKVLARIAETGRLKSAPTFEERAPTTEDIRARIAPASPTCPPELQRRRKLREGGVRRWLAAAAAVAVISAGGARYYLYQQTVAEAVRVQADIRVALQITGEKIALVQRKVEDLQR